MSQDKIEKMAFFIEEVAETTGLHYNTIYRKVVSGEIPAVRVGSRWLISKKNLEAMLDGKTPVRAGVS